MLGELLNFHVVKPNQCSCYFKHARELSYYIFIKNYVRETRVGSLSAIWGR